MQRLRPDDPETIGRYTLVARLGSGGMGVVFLATAGSQSVALKVVRTSYLDNTHLHSRFVREIETLKKIDSPYVARIFDYAVEEDTAWHAVEFVSGPTLKQKVETDGPLDAGEWEKLARELHAGLDDIHRLGIVHRDLKPANMVMGDSGVKLIDFGIAQDDDATSMTMTGLVAGSPAWMSPERLEGEDDSPASDLFSAGSVLTFAATGKSPWGASDKTTVSTMLTRIIGGTPNLEGLTPDQERVVRGLLHPDPTRRSWPNRELPAQTVAQEPARPMESPAVTSPPRPADCGCSRWERGWGNTQYRLGKTYCLRCGGVVWPKEPPPSSQNTDIPHELMSFGNCDCRGWQRTWGTQYLDGKTLCLRCGGNVWALDDRPPGVSWRVIATGVRTSFFVVVGTIVGANFFIITPFAGVAIVILLVGVVAAVGLLVREILRLKDENAGRRLGLKLLAAVVGWILLAVAVFVSAIYLFDWLYWGL